MSAAVKIWQDETTDWCAQCDGACQKPLRMWTEDWETAYETGIGHALMHHPRERHTS